MHSSIRSRAGLASNVAFPASLLRRDPVRPKAVPSWLAAGIIGLLCGAGFCSTLLYACGHQWPEVPETMGFLFLAANDHPLPPGETAPEITAPGWIGKPPSAADLRGKVLVVDVWADW